MYDWEFYAGFFSVCEAVVGGYVAAVLVHLALMYLVTREGRGVLTADGGMSRAYYVQLGLCWIASAAVGSVVALYVFPEMPMALISVSCIAAMLCLALVRMRNKVPHQQTWMDTVLLLLCVLAGITVPAYLKLI